MSGTAWISRRRAIIVMAVYAAFVLLYFSLRSTGSYMRWIAALPVAYIAVSGFIGSRKGGLLMPLAFAASAAGDMAGAYDVFFVQVALFAAAHIFFICDFSRNITFSRSGVGWSFFMAVAMTLYSYYLFCRIESSAVMTAVAIYAVVIFIMAVSAIMRGGRRRVWYALAAVIFVISDSLIACGIAGCKVAHAGLWIMATYYAAQGIFAALYFSRKSRLD